MACSVSLERRKLEDPSASLNAASTSQSDANAQGNVKKQKVEESTKKFSTTANNCDATLNYDRINIIERDGKFDKEEVGICQEICDILKMRGNYHPEEEQHPSEWGNLVLDGRSLKLEEGVFYIHGSDGEQLSHDIVTFRDFTDHLEKLWKFCGGPAKTYCWKRLQILEKKYELHVLLNGDTEREGIKKDPADFFNIHKVDNHVHAAGMMTAPHLLQFIKDRAAHTIQGKDGKEITVKEFVAAELNYKDNLDVTELTIDELNVQMDETVFARFDNFNAHYNPFGNKNLRDIFLKSSGPNNGKFFRDIILEVLEKTEEANHEVYLEPRLSIYGKNENEWDELAQWMVSKEGKSGKSLCDSKITKWLIQFPRIFRFFVGKSGCPENFEEYLANLFKPLFEVSIDPSSHPQLEKFLEHVVGFDSVDDESPFDELVDTRRTPEEWKSNSPPYSYFGYYMWANIRSLNQLRAAKGLSTFAFRPHCGEAGQIHHLATMFLLADDINHGIRASKEPVIMYLYYLAQIGMSISPLSNNALFLPLTKNPLKKFHSIGMNVTISTDDPLQFHNTSEPLIEEYTVCRQLFKFSTTDLAEICERSVRQSGWSHEEKVEMLGPAYFLSGAQGNQTHRTNLPDCRCSFRYNNLADEYRTLWNASNELERTNNEVLFSDGMEEAQQLALPASDGTAIDAPNKDMTESWMDFMKPLKSATLWQATEEYNIQQKISNKEAVPHNAEELMFEKGDIIVVFPETVNSNGIRTIHRLYSDSKLSTMDICGDGNLDSGEPQPVRLEKIESEFLERNSESLISDDFWVGKDKYGREGKFQKTKGKIIQHGKFISYHSIRQLL